MSQHVSSHRARLHLEPLEDRCTPSALLGHASAHEAALPGKPPAPVAIRAADAGQHAVPIQMSAHIMVDSSGVLNVTGVGSHLGRWTGQGVIDSLVIDPVADRVTVQATATLIAANGDQLFLSIAVSMSLTTRLGEETVTFTGGTGRFAGASGSVTGVCETTWDPASSLPFECDSESSGTLVLAHAP
jgi:hypothetical protein